MKLLKTKNEVKALAEKIKNTRKLYRDGQSAASKGNPIEGLVLWRTCGDLYTLIWQFRHMHIAYCIARGRTYEEIERVCYNPPDQKLIEKYLEKIKAEAAEYDAAHAPIA
jgi:hypothetical protein